MFTDSVWEDMTVEKLQEWPLIPLRRDRFGWSAIHWAARCSTKAVLMSLRDRMHQEMLSHKSFEDELNRAAGPTFQRVTPLQLAVMYNRSPEGAEVVHWMLLHGACVDVQVDGRTLEQLARTYKNVYARHALGQWVAPTALPREPRSPTGLRNLHVRCSGRSAFSSLPSWAGPAFWPGATSCRVFRLILLCTLMALAVKTTMVLMANAYSWK